LIPKDRKGDTASKRATQPNTQISQNIGVSVLSKLGAQQCLSDDLRITKVLFGGSEFVVAIKPVLFFFLQKIAMRKTPNYAQI